MGPSSVLGGGLDPDCTVLMPQNKPVLLSGTGQPKGRIYYMEIILQ